MTRSVSGSERRPTWQPEPLHLPAELPRERDERDKAHDNAEQNAEQGGERDRPGSHVIVIDIS